MPPEALRITLPRLPPQTPIQEFLAQIKAAKRTSAIDDRDFILASRILQWFRSPSPKDKSFTGRNNAARVLHAVCGVDDTPHRNTKLLDHINNDSRCWLRTFAVLLQMDHEDQNMGRYIHRFAELDFLDQRLGCPVKDNLKEEVLQYLNISPPDAERLAKEFEDLQWQLYTDTTLNEADNQVYHYGTRKILPITQKVVLTEGDTSAIYQIEVPCECIPPSLAARVKRKPYSTPRGKAQQMTLKVIHREPSYNLERAAYKALDQKKDIVECFGYWQFVRNRRRKEYHVLLEWGAHDLKEFFRCYTPPTTTDAIIQFWEGFLCIVSGLATIHEVVVSGHDGPETWYGWHCDLKPANILFCEEGHQKGWKVADPGFARFIRADRVEKSQGLPIAEMHGGTTSYGAPEASNDRSPKVTQRFDIWSLGCVLSEAATWVVLGHRGVQRYHGVRRLDPSGIDGFHNRLDKSKAVRDWHSYLRHSLRASDTITEKILTVVENFMLQADPHMRHDASTLKAELDAVIDFAKASLDEHPSPERYKIPDYFQKAIDQEQVDEAEEMQARLASGGHEKWTNKHKSQAFYDATKVPLGHHDEQIPDMLAQVMSPASNDLSLPTVYRSGTLPVEPSRDFYHQKSTQIAKQGPGRESSSKIMSADYWEAREILEDNNWRSGTLEFSEELPEASQLEAATPLTPKPGSSAIYSQLHQTAPFAITSSQTTRPRGTSVPGSFKSLLTKSFSLRRKRKSTGSIQAVADNSNRPLPTVLQPLDTDISAIDMLQPSKSGQYKYDKLDDYFQGRDIAFLIDNGSSMQKHWMFARDLLVVLTAFLYGQDDDGMDLYFTSRRQKVGTYEEPKDFFEEMGRNKPQRAAKGQPSSEPPSMARIPSMYKTTPPRTNTHATTSSTASNELNAEDIRDSLREILDNWGSRQFKKKGKKLTLIIFTDGIWNDVKQKQSVSRQIVSLLEWWLDKNTHKEQLENRGLSIQFVRFGNDTDAIEELDRMDKNLTMSDGTQLPDIIDHEPAEGNIYKMILGSLDERYDVDDEVSISGEQGYMGSSGAPTLTSSPVSTRSVLPSYMKPNPSQTFDVRSSRQN
ncbi:hypothetical protein BKA67DRAFT_531800 [Truncatella angustata]|uniref:Protein kinase domain-containing protein n=1 Tax=Truncatella angustata TaxID=152316 RepID=A0A9P8UR64_9PEZI|nr:uncharacterized protein BKA67DRAFT_531800 [Truncatella angustata]KAH6656535.1 hypothetical protein BKA67DRAFT_531800 [Truncatella angustata]KAH8193627.1 hypothetical protein TruAng_012206 [Truncatella angustata]